MSVFGEFGADCVTTVIRPLQQFSLVVSLFGLKVAASNSTRTHVLLCFCFRMTLLKHFAPPDLFILWGKGCNKHLLRQTNVYMCQNVYAY